MDRKNGLLPAERQEAITRYIKTHGSGQIRELAELLGVSEATARRDLDELAAEGLIDRTHGGAVAAVKGISFERKREERMLLCLEEKQRIAAKAISLISDGDTLFLDSGTTVFAFAELLSRFKELTIYTNDIAIAQSILLDPTSTLIVTGGIRRGSFSNVLYGAGTLSFLENIRVDKAIMGADALDLDFGISNSNFQEAEIKRLAMKIGKQTILLADRSKLGCTSMVKVCDLEDVDILITDTDADDRFLSALSGRIDCIYPV